MKFSERLALTGPPGSSSVPIYFQESSHSDRANHVSRDRGRRDPLQKSDEAALLLLSIRNIAKQEIGDEDLDTLWQKQDSNNSMPLFPRLSYRRQNLIPPRSEVEEHAMDSEKDAAFFSRHRARTVSMDSPISSISLLRRTASPLELTAFHNEPKLVSPLPYRNRTMHRSLRLSHKAKKDYAEDEDDDQHSLEPDSPRHDSVTDSPKRSNKKLQGAPPKGKSVKKIFRKKFSWKNYPELEQFLIANREEYLRHSALNYTVQQKQYNNRLTERLLELATAHGYMFDEADFSFVTVRDRIRCFFKSYVQSNKKKGVLLGYSARKAGLLTEEELEEAADSTRIITPLK